jgi:hypothetical protein
VLRRKAIVWAALAACLAAPQVARANSDPASHFLTTENVFYPYQQSISKDLKAKLAGATAAAKKAGYPIKVAIIATGADLGGVSNFFNQPARYAGYLGPQIGFNRKTQPLLIVMPAGLATFQAGPKASTAIDGVEVEEGGDGLARAALEGVSNLSAAAGHPIKGFKPEDSGSGGTSAVVFAIPVALLVIVLAVMSYRRAGDDEDEGEEGREAAAGAG